MKLGHILSVVVFVPLVWTSPSGAISDEQYQVIRKLGELNGVALHCGYFDETRRMKKALVSNLPKRRQLGQAFDDITNDSYLALIEQKAVCPDAGVFTGQVGEAILILEAAFAER